MKKGTTEYYNNPLNELNIAVPDIEKIAHTDDNIPSYNDFLKDEIELLNKDVYIEADYVIMLGIQTMRNF